MKTQREGFMSGVRAHLIPHPLHAKFTAIWHDPGSGEGGLVDQRNGFEARSWVITFGASFTTRLLGAAVAAEPATSFARLSAAF